MILAHFDQDKQISENLTESFLEIVQSVSELLTEHGFNIQPYKDANNLEFLKLDLASQLKTIEHFKIYAEVLIDTHRSEELQDTRVLLWNMLKRMGYFPTDDILSKIQNHHIIEIYNKQNVQVFRNLSFFKVCSYSLDEILCIPWWKLYHREEKISQEIFKFGSMILSGELKHSISPDIPTHVLAETSSRSNYTMNVDINYLSSLESHEGDKAALVLETAHLI